MTEVPAGSAAPVAEAAPPAANAVPAPDAPTGQDQATPSGDQSVQAPRMLSEDEHNALVSKRVSERLAKERRRLEREARLAVERDFYKERLEQPAKPQQTEPAKGKPEQKDFHDFESWQDAVVDWKLEQRLAKQEETRKQSSAQEQQQRAQADAAQRIRETLVAKGKKEFKDFEEVAFSDVPITGPMAAAIAKLPNGHKVWYHLGQNPDEAARIAELDYLDQTWEVRNLESKLTAPPTPTKTPPPIVPNSGQAKVTKDYSEMTTAEHVEAWRNRKKR